MNRLKKAFIGSIGLVLLCGPVIASGQETTPSTVSPDSPQAAAPAPVLSSAELERLLSLTRVVVSPIAREDSQEDEASVLDVAELEHLTREIEAADQLLAKLSRDASSTASELMGRLLKAPEPGIRATALRWLAGRPDVADRALAEGINDRNSMVRLVTEQIFLENGASAEQLASIQAARKDGGDKLTLEIKQVMHSRKEKTSTGP